MTGPTAPKDGRDQARPRVVAHRGASDEVAEHTMGAYRQALVDGADALECDVRLTRDGHLVCVHDRRLDRTSSGRGVVSTKRLDQLQSLDWASWKNPWADLDDEAELPDENEGRVLTLRDLLVLVRDQPGPVGLLVETKHPTRYSGLVEQRLVELLEEFGWAHPGSGTAADRAAAPVRVLSYSQLSLRRMRSWAPTVPLAWVIDQEIPARVRRGELPRGVGDVAVACELVRTNTDWVQRMHEWGYGVYVWVVNTADDLRMCHELAVEAVITDRPRFARETLDARGAP
ncbi:MAG TPA: glycerophosphodiester phosphodiesterase family protein [Nocardioidaceae bacterium]|nr:glycerophosphodiester phosphodiesterase family protein [Nocardioidaceae bacterium]